MTMSKSPNCGSLFPSDDFDQTYPWLLVSQGTNLENHTFYNISHNQHFNRNISDLCNKQVALTSYGSWRALISYGWHTLTHLGQRRVLDCCLFNTTSKVKIQLPHIEISYSISLKYECVLSKPPTHPDCYVLLISCWDDVMLYCRIGDEQFIKTSKAIGDDYLSTAVNVDGKIYGWMTESHSFVRVALKGDQILLEPFLVNNFPTSLDHYLLEYFGDILLVNMFWHKHTDSQDAAYFTIYRVNIVERKCSLLRNIGEYAIFLGRYGSTSALCTRKSGVKKNSIYYYKNDKNLYVYDIEDRSKTLIKPCPIKGSVFSSSDNPFLICWT